MFLFYSRLDYLMHQSGLSELAIDYLTNYSKATLSALRFLRLAASADEWKTPIFESIKDNLSVILSQALRNADEARQIAVLEAFFGLLANLAVAHLHISIFFQFRQRHSAKYVWADACFQHHCIAALNIKCDKVSLQILQVIAHIFPYLLSLFVIPCELAFRSMMD